MSRRGRQCCGEWLDGGLCAILPRYEQDGSNGTDILFEDGSRINHKRKVRAVIKELASLYQKDLTLIREHAAKALGQKTMLPISITPGITLVPFKVRKPIGQNDGAIGYVFESAVVKLYKAEKGSLIKLKGGFEVSVFENIKTANRHIENAERARKNALQYGLKHEQMSLVLNELREEYERPVTRGDIAILLRSLLSLMEKLGCK